MLAFDLNPRKLLPAFAIVLALSSCKGKEEKDNGQEIPVQTGFSVLLTPDVPDSLADNPDKAIHYALTHFWDKLDFRDTARSRNQEFMEQNFANFLSLFPYASPETRRDATVRLMKKAESDTAAYTITARMADLYLYEPNSPYYSEDNYILFLEETTSNEITGSDVLRYRYQLEMAMKNRPGSKATDFNFITREGKKTSLHTIPTHGEILLIFYDPSCDHCHEVIEMLKADESLQRAIDRKMTTVLAIYSGEERSLWEKTNGELPKEWIVGYEPGKIEEEDLYEFRASPTLYLLDADRKVIKKDFTM